MKNVNPKIYVAVIVILTLALIGTLFYSRPNPADDFDVTSLLAKAEHNDPQAEFNLYILNMTSNPDEAIVWLKKASEHGLAEAQYHYANALWYGDKVPVDQAEAAAWYKKSADQGFEEAQITLDSIPAMQYAQTLEDTPPVYDIEVYCSYISTMDNTKDEAAYSTCFKAQKRSYSNVKSNWGIIPNAIKERCLKLLTVATRPDYSVLDGCIRKESEAKASNQNLKFSY